MTPYKTICGPFRKTVLVHDFTKSEIKVIDPCKSDMSFKVWYGKNKQIYYA